MSRINRLGDKMLSRLVPRSRASACTYPTSCTYRFTGCGGSYCYYYYQWWKTCYVFSSPSTGCAGNLVRTYSGCC